DNPSFSGLNEIAVSQPATRGFRNRRWLVPGAVAAAVLLIGVGLWAGGVFTTSVKTQPHSEPTTSVSAPTPPKVTSAASRTATLAGGQWRIEGQEIVQQDSGGGSAHLQFGDSKWT